MSELTDRLGFARVEEIAEFLLKHMSMETRGKLMAELPQHYALLYPGVKEETIVAAVQRQMWQSRRPKTILTPPVDRKMINKMRADRGLEALPDSHFDAMDELQQRGER